MSLITFACALAVLMLSLAVEAVVAADDKGSYGRGQIGAPVKGNLIGTFVIEKLLI